MQPPKNVKQVQSILGFFNFYTRFARNYAEATLPLLKLTRKGEKFKWTEEQENALNRMKKLFIDNIMLKYADPQKPFISMTDASDFAISGALSQMNDEKKSKSSYL